MGSKEKNIIEGQDFFYTIKVFQNEQGNQGIVIRGHMEVYVTKSIKKGYRLVYVCYEGDENLFSQYIVTIKEVICGYTWV